jgi:hypothetical protein
VAELLAPLLIRSERRETTYDRTVGYPTHYRKRTDLGRQAKEGVHKSKKLSLSGEVIYDVQYSIGQDGFRITPSGGSNVKPRINFFGCSYTFGEGLNDNETLPYFVRQRLKNVSVRNFGFHGWGAHQALAILQSERDTKGETNFFLTAPWHVQRSACKVAFTNGSPRYKIASNGSLVRRGTCHIDNNATLAEEFLSYSNLYLAYKKVLNDLTNDDYELYFAIVNQIAEISRRRNQKFVVGFIKASDSSFGWSGYTNEKFYFKLKEITPYVIDLTLANKDEEVDGKFRIHSLDGHPSALANNERARLLVDFLHYLKHQ